MKWVCKLQAHHHRRHLLPTQPPTPFEQVLNKVQLHMAGTNTTTSSSSSGGGTAKQVEPPPPPPPPQPVDKSSWPSIIMSPFVTLAREVNEFGLDWLTTMRILSSYDSKQTRIQQTQFRTVGLCFVSRTLDYQNKIVTIVFKPAASEVDRFGNVKAVEMDASHAFGPLTVEARARRHCEDLCWEIPRHYAMYARSRAQQIQWPWLPCVSPCYPTLTRSGGGGAEEATFDLGGGGVTRPMIPCGCKECLSRRAIVERRAKTIELQQRAPMLDPEHERVFGELGSGSGGGGGGGGGSPTVDDWPTTAATTANVKFPYDQPLAKRRQVSRKRKTGKVWKVSS